MDAFVDRIVQYSAKDNAEMRCRIKISGKWFGGRLTVAERLVDYDAEANGWKPSHKFKTSAARGRRSPRPPSGSSASRT